MDPLNHAQFIFVAAVARHQQCVARLSGLTFQEQVAALKVPAQHWDETTTQRVSFLKTLQPRPSPSSD
ncbi:hypothetical protein E2C01_017193 [Portunus trituberculatus]|uniref:Uncharacterized protein n=1 Tax=Portunus trituberculatus TaxID=210409 RepID=A0A5B7DR94_PORTR|nr:hypothetical protein [Portunus trituberculatus]